MDTMSDIARTVLYEGYLLWPYRRSAIKNQRRWGMGALAAPSPAGSGTVGDRTNAQTQCLLETTGNAPFTLDVTVRFLHVVDRQVLRGGEAVDELRVDGRLYQSWEEATEREVGLREQLAPGARFAARRTFAVPGGERVEELDGDGTSLIRRRWRRIEGEAEIVAEPVDDEGLLRLTVRLDNTTPDGDPPGQRQMASAHLALRVTAGAGFVSAVDPPVHLREAADSCVNDGLWPVLAGEPGSRDAMLAAPIILYDWPQVAPESPGDLFDATEIDRMLVLNVLSMTAEEQEEMAAADPRAQEILRRCAGLTQDQTRQLHGTFRDIEETW